MVAHAIVALLGLVSLWHDLPVLLPEAMQIRRKHSKIFFDTKNLELLQKEHLRLQHTRQDLSRKSRRRTFVGPLQGLSCTPENTFGRLADLPSLQVLGKTFFGLLVPIRTQEGSMVAHAIVALLGLVSLWHDLPVLLPEAMQIRRKHSKIFLDVKSMELLQEAFAL